MKNSKSTKGRLIGGTVLSLLGMTALTASVVWHTPNLKLRLFKWLFESGERETLGQLTKGEIDFSGMIVESDIAYRHTGNKGHLIDIYRPEVEDPTKALIINVHGGGLFASYKETNLKFNLEFVKRGHTVVNVSYQLLPDTTFWHQIDDVMAAYRFLQDNQKELKLNLANVHIVGDSAGALLTLMSTAVNNSPNLQEVFGIKGSGLSIKGLGLISIMLDNQRKDLMSFINGFIINDADKRRQSLGYLLNPASVVEKAQLPPTYLVTSQEDLIQKDTLKLESLLVETGVPYELSHYNKGKERKLVHVFAVIHPEWPESQSVIRSLSDFFNQDKTKI